MPWGLEEFVFVKHLRQDPAEPLRIDQGQNPSFRYAKMTRASRVYGFFQFRDSAQAFLEMRHCPRNALPRASLFDDCRRAQRQESYQWSEP